MRIVGGVCIEGEVADGQKGLESDVMGLLLHAVVLHAINWCRTHHIVDERNIPYPGCRWAVRAALQTGSAQTEDSCPDARRRRS